MKNIITQLTLLGAVAIANAQTIASAEVSPQIGDNFTMQQSTWISPGGAGANQTWDLSAMTNTATVTVNHTASTTPGANINQAWSTGANYHLNVGGTKHDVISQVAQGVTIAFSNPWTMYEFPLSLNATGTDTYAASFTANGVTFQRTGTSTWLVDGTGTLITPSGTFTNVVRVKIISEYTDASTVIDLDYELETYIWFKAGIRHWIAQLESTETFQGTVSGGLYTNVSTGGGVSIGENQISYSVHPNPCSDYIHIKGSNEDQIAKTQIIDVSGKIVAESNQTSIDVSHVANGIYHLIILDAQNSILSREKFIKQ